MNPIPARERRARYTGIQAAVERICCALEDEPPERWLSSLGTTVSYVIRCAEVHERAALTDRWVEMLREQVQAGIREDAH